MLPRQSFLALTCLALSGVFIATCQTSTAVAPVPGISIQVAGKPALVLTDEDLLEMPQHTVKIKEHENEAAYTGVYLHDILVRAGAPSGNQLHGRSLSSYVLASAKDEYQAVFTLTEMDPTFTDDEVLVADRVNGTPLPDKQGPFRIVAAHDKKPARSVRMLEKIEVVQLRK